MSFRLRLTDDKFEDHWIEHRFEWLWNYPFVAIQLLKTWRNLYGKGTQ